MEQLPILSIKNLFAREDVKSKFQELLGKRASSFMTSVLQIVASNNLLAKAEPTSIYHSAAVAATLDLPLNNNLGFAYIVPYNQRQPDGQYKTVAQFQLGYKGFIQLAQRSGQFKTIAAACVYEGQLIEQNPLTGFRFDFTQKKSDNPIGYAAYFELLNGFQKTLFMSIDDLRKHGLKYSKTFGNEKTRKSSLWENDFDSMATKTVIKQLLSKFAPLSVEMQRAVITDQALIKDPQAEDIEYVDNDETKIDKESERVRLMIEDAKSEEDLDAVYEHVGEGQLQMFLDKKEELTKTKTKK
jgi:recombination protein RecT